MFPCDVKMVLADLNTSRNLPPSGCSLRLIGFIIFVCGNSLKFSSADHCEGGLLHSVGRDYYVFYMRLSSYSHERNPALNKKKPGTSFSN